ncbi:diaminopimelate epimerase [Paenibacillus sp. YPG26]|uniref:diaminopimelate epimerase n=1 Tax=Paenibacillus sp. YPG26 TaxID=2878915 RepID=UPI0020417724|nr:diaminopimelate epimerase [Paenibacillus sp. YPG26]USB31755.1 diaminopimelate epimerase [Paenibacillus sp. YPG26]
MKREIDFVKFNPTQNMTILVKTKHAPEEHTPIASRMMSYDHVYAEQVGFIEEPRKHEAAVHLQMAGGEFCGNACMALAAYLASEQGSGSHEMTEIVLEASGIDQLVTCQVKTTPDKYFVQVAMPVPSTVELKTVKYDGEALRLVIVRYRDFVHIVIEVEQFSAHMRQTAEGLARLLGVIMDASLIGILLFKPDSDELAPLIYVPRLDSMIWERGCGSGTASIGAYLAWKNKREITLPVMQPGGTIHVTANWTNDGITAISIEGTVGIVAQGKAFIEV